MTAIFKLYLPKPNANANSQKIALRNNLTLPDRKKWKPNVIPSVLDDNKGVLDGNVRVFTFL